MPCLERACHHCRFNFDGLLSFDTWSDGRSGSAYAQAFRNGAAEFVDVSTLTGAVQQQVLPVTLIEKSVIRGLTEYVRVMGDLGVTPPLVVMPSLLGVLGCHIVRGHRALPTSVPTDRNDLLLPDVLVEDEGTDAAQLLRPAFDALWQAAGWRGSQSYDEHGRWVES